MRREDLGQMLERLIRARDSAGLVDLFFSGNPPKLRAGFNREDQHWDFKAGCPSTRKEHDLAWAEIAALVLAFHNAAGGVIFFGIENANYSFCGTVTPIDSAQFNSKIRRYVGDTFGSRSTASSVSRAVFTSAWPSFRRTA